MMRRPSLFLACLLCLTACDDGEAPPPDSGVTPPPDSGQMMMMEDDPLRADCDPVVPELCAMPFPSDYWLTDDSSTPSGHRLNLGPTTLPRSKVRRRQHVDPTPINGRDGWSVNGTLLAYLPGATATGLPGIASIGDSLETTSPTILMNAETGELVPHWSEIDEAVADDSTPRTFFIRPVVQLQHGTRYLVAIRNVVDASGAAIAPSETFLALRDGTATEIATLEARRDHFEEIFTTLGEHGVTRDDLQLAWDFTTVSLEDDTRWMLSVRDQALAVVGADGPEFTLDEEMSRTYTEEENANIRRRLYGTIRVPLYMTDENAGSRLNLGADGMPEQNGFAEYGIVINIPRSATPDNPVHPIQYGHGLLGDFTQANAGWLAEFGNTNGYMPFGVSWLGMAGDDVAPLTVALANGTLQDFATIPERLHQGIVNALLAMRMMLGRMATHPEMMMDDGTGTMRSILDTSAGYYTGDSQGGIFGGTYMAITTDVERGILGVPGAPYHLLLNRSVDFDPYLSLLRQSFEDGPQIQLAIATLQQLWDRAEPGSYVAHIENDPLPDTPSHRVILQVALGDHQVTPLGAHIMARNIGAVTIEPETRSIWGIEQVAGPHPGSAIVEWDFGLPPETATNVPQREGSDPHGDVRRNPAALAQSLHFFQTGEVIHTCDGVCDPD